MAAIPYIGQSVQFKLDSGPNAGTYRPAVVVGINGSASTTAKCNLYVQLDGPDYSGPDMVTQTYRNQISPGTTNGTFKIISDVETTAAYAAGTAYSLTATAAALTFGTTQPSIVLPAPGTYLLRAKVNLQYNGATFAANRTVTLKLRRTNETAADVTNGSTAFGTGVVTTTSGTLGIFSLPEVLYTTLNSDDAITIFGVVSVVPTAGSLDATEASIIAIPQD